ncbi:MAG TPA: rhomboid family intramembrane serine protease [Anaeromyxobacter sp.]
MARRSDFSSVFTFGGRVPASVGFLLALMLAASVWAAMNHAIGGEAVLAPIAVRRGELWRLFTWVLVQPDPGTLLFGGFMLWWIGQQLSYEWSERRFVLRVVGTTLFAGVVTTLLGLAWDRASTVAHLGMWPLVNALLISWAMLHPGAQVNIWGVLPITGRNLALLVTGGTVLYALWDGVPSFTPHLAALALAWAQARGGVGGGRSWKQARRWWADREAKRRSRHLKVVRKNGSDGRSDWLN